MDTVQLERALYAEPTCRDKFKGVYASDRLPQRIKDYPCCYIANVDRSGQKGSHWCAFFFDQEENGQFFDSYGNPPEFYTSRFNTFLNRNCTKWDFNTIRVQSDFTTVCGQYCLYYILFKCKGGSLNDMMNLFGEDFYNNDVAVNDVVKRHFSLKTTVYDEEFVKNQICKALKSER